jgi:N-acetylmuramoyl-L-alanine amidase
MSKGKWTHLIIHHTGAEEKDTAQVRRYHLSLGWRDIGYHYVIERDGRVVPGRSLELAGAHCIASGMNQKGIGIAVLGNLENHPPLPAQEIVLKQLVGELMGRFQIPLANVLGHKEVPGAATACPGRFLSMDSLRSAVMAGGVGGGSSGPAPPAAGNDGRERIYRVQVGAYKIRKNAENMAGKLKSAGFPAIIVEGTLDSSP